MKSHIYGKLFRASRHGLFHHVPSFPCRPFHGSGGLISPQIIQALRLIILKLAQVIQQLQNSELCTGYWRGHRFGVGERSQLALKKMQLVIAQIVRYVRYLFPQHQDDQRPHQADPHHHQADQNHHQDDHHHHDDQYDVAHDTSYLPPSQGRPPYVPRYEGRPSTTTARTVPQYLDSYGK